jgi:hypothetical protein
MDRRKRIKNKVVHGILTASYVCDAAENLERGYPTRGEALSEQDYLTLTLHDTARDAALWLGAWSA